MIFQTLKGNQIIMPNEKIEWTRCWREDADTDKKRILLVGDSLIDGSKREVFYALPDGYATTAVITSKGVDDPYFTKEILLFCEQENFDYQAVYFNNGIHEHAQTPEVFGANLKKALQILMEKIPNAKWILGLCTPATPCDDAGQYYEAPVTLDLAEGFAPVCRRILLYNEQIKKVAGELGIPYYDAFSLLQPHPEFKRDAVHLNEEGRALFGKAIAEQLKKLLGLE